MIKNLVFGLFVSLSSLMSNSLLASSMEDQNHAFTDLPNDLIKVCMSKLDMQSLVSLSRTQKRLRSYAQTRHVLEQVKKNPKYVLPKTTKDKCLDAATCVSVMICNFCEKNPAYVVAASSLAAATMLAIPFTQSDMLIAQMADITSSAGLYFIASEKLNIPACISAMGWISGGVLSQTISERQNKREKWLAAPTVEVQDLSHLFNEEE